MIKEIYSNSKVTLIIKEDVIEVKYLGTIYSTKYDLNIVECLARLLNKINSNAPTICLGVINILNIMEPPQQKTIKFNGEKYIAT